MLPHHFDGEYQGAEHVQQIKPMTAVAALLEEDDDRVQDDREQNESTGELVLRPELLDKTNPSRRRDRHGSQSPADYSAENANGCMNLGQQAAYPQYSSDRRIWLQS